MRPDLLFSRKTNGECGISLDYGREGFLILREIIIGELYRWGSSSAFEGMKRNPFRAYDIRITLDGL